MAAFPTEWGGGVRERETEREKEQEGRRAQGLLRLKLRTSTLSLSLYPVDQSESLGQGGYKMDLIAGVGVAAKSRCKGFAERKENNCGYFCNQSTTYFIFVQ